MSKFSEIVTKAKSERILAFDLLRGYFLFVILLNHLEFYPNGLGLVTGRGLLYVSTAEGFFVVSGLVLGMVRGRKLINQPLKVATKLLWKRSFQLYITSIVLTLIFTLIGSFFINNPGLKSGIYPNLGDVWRLTWDTITLSYSYGWADFLRLYAIFIFFAPAALWLLRKGKWYIMLLISFAVWALYPYVSQDTAVSQPFSWQFIFFAGFAVGFHWQTIVAKWRSLSLKARRIIGWSFVSAFIITASASAILVFGSQLDGELGAHIESVHHIVEQGFSKDRLPLPRILLGVVWFWGLFYAVRRFESTIVKYFGWLLLEFGSNSLYVYTVSAFVIFFIHLFITPPGFNSLYLNLLVSLMALGVVHLAVKTKFLMKLIPR